MDYHTYKTEFITPQNDINKQKPISAASRPGDLLLLMVISFRPSLLFTHRLRDDI